MRRSVRGTGILGFTAVAFLLGACSGGGKNTVGGPMEEDTGGSTGTPTGGKMTTPTGGKGGSGGATGGAGGEGGSTGGASGGADAGMAGEGGSMGGMDGGAAGAGGATGGAGGGGNATDWMGYPGIRDLSQVKKTAGCGMANSMPTGQWIRFNTAVPVPAGHDGPGGDGMRTYYVKLPTGYDPAKPYKVVIGGSSCVTTQSPAAINFDGVTNASGGAIQITPIVEPGVMAEGSYVCYDDKDTNSIEYPFIEKFLKEVGDKFCYDENKIFVEGHSSGGWYTNMMMCVYGSTLLRGGSSNGGGIARGGPPISPPCKTTPMAGLWILPTGDPEGRPDTGDALNKALKQNKCEGGDAANAYMTAPTEPWTVGGAVNCKKYKCPEAFPVVFCQPGGGHGNVSWHASAAWAFFNALP